MALSSRVMNSSKKKDFLIFLDSISIFYDPYKDKRAFPIPHPSCLLPSPVVSATVHLQEKSGSIFSVPSHCRQHQDPPTPSLTSEQTQFTQLLPVCHILPFLNHLGNLLLNSVLTCFLTGEPQNGEDTPGTLLGWVQQTDSAIEVPNLMLAISPWPQDKKFPSLLLAIHAHNQTGDFEVWQECFEKKKKKNRVSADN